MHREAGFSLVEATVAAVVLAVGVLGVTGSGTAARRLADLASLEADAARLLGDRLHRLAGSPCTAASGTAQQSRFAETWTVSGGPALRMVRIELAAPDGGRTRRWDLDAALLCADSLP